MNGGTHLTGREITLREQLSSRLKVAALIATDAEVRLPALRAELRASMEIVEELDRIADQRRATREQRDVGGYVGAWG